jgi:hypothetical protein
VNKYTSVLGALDDASFDSDIEIELARRAARIDEFSTISGVILYLITLGTCGFIVLRTGINEQSTQAFLAIFGIGGAGASTAIARYNPMSERNSEDRKRIETLIRSNRILIMAIKQQQLQNSYNGLNGQGYQTTYPDAQQSTQYREPHSQSYEEQP